MDLKDFKIILKYAVEEAQYRKPSMDKFLNLQTKKPDGNYSRILDLEPELKDLYIKKFFEKTGPYDSDSQNKLNQIQHLVEYIKENAPEGEVGEVAAILEKVFH